MDFSENTKKEVKTKAHYRCCMCENALPLEVHHIIPESKGGPNTIDNAIALCPNYHNIYGNNPDHRKGIKEKRDFWYVRCAKESVIIEKLAEMDNTIIAHNVSSESKYNCLVSIVQGLVLQSAQILSKVSSASPPERINLMSNFAAASGTITTVTNAITQLSKDIYHCCPNCKSIITINKDQSSVVCPGCKIEYKTDDLIKNEMPYLDNVKLNHEW